MKASELITRLQQAIDTNGDVEVTIDVDGLPGLGKVFGCFVEYVVVGPDDIVVTAVAP